MKKITLLFLLFAAISTDAQILEQNKKNNDLKIASLPYYSYGKGLGVTSPDSLFQFNIRFRIQNRVSYYDNENADPYYEGQVRRLRLRFDGFVGNPHFLYVIQLSFAPGDTGPVQDGQNLNIIRDAVIYYRPNKRWQIAFGQTKLPGNRQTVNSSGALELTDRSINNTRFSIDRDFGIQLNQLNEFPDKFSYNFKGSVSTGEGRNVTGNNDTGLAATGKVELLPLGAFTKDGAYFEGDLMREQKPKLMVSGVYSQNNQALRAGGQYGLYLYQPRTMKLILLDAIFKYKGFAAMASYMARNTGKDPVTVSPTDPTLTRYVFTGHGEDYEMSYLFKSNYQVIGRFSNQHAADEIRNLVPNTRELTFGLTKYLREHTFKLQGEVSYDKLDYLTADTGHNWYVRFQVEIGI